VFGASPLVHQIYVYGNSSQPSLLAVVVPGSRAVESRGLAEQKALIATALQEIGAASGLQPYEIPRDLIIETRPFTTDDGLLTGIGKLVRPRLRERYGERLEKLYAEVARQRNDELENLRTTGGELPVVEGVLRAATALLQPVGGRLVPEDRLTQCGGDSMAAVDLSTLLEDMFDVEVPVFTARSHSSRESNAPHRVVETANLIRSAVPTTLGPNSCRAASLALCVSITLAAWRARPVPPSRGA
jgi:fatty acid CoA ligase FadD9